MEIIFSVSLGLEKSVISTRVGRRTINNSEPFSLDEEIDWYARHSRETPGFKSINERSSISREIYLVSRFMEIVLRRTEGYHISYSLVSEDEARRVVQDHKGFDDE